MTKKDILFLLLPSVLFVAIGMYALRYSRLVLTRSDASSEQFHSQAFERFVEKVQRGELTPDKMIDALRSSQRVADAYEEVQTKTSHFLQALG